MERMLPHDWQPKWCATLVYICRGDEVLLIEKLRGHGAGKVNVPGGKVEDETPVNGASREVREEVGLTVKNPRLVAKLRFHDFVTDYRVLGFVYLASEFDGTPIRTDEATPFWCKRADIPYSRMWEDDELWLPVILAGQFVDADLLFEDDVLVNHVVRINEHGLQENRDL